MRTRLFATCFGFLLIAAQVPALTLNDALAEVLNTHPAIEEQLKNYNSSVHIMNRSTRAFSPQVDLQAELGWQDVSNSSTRYHSKDSDTNAVRIVGKQLVYDGKRSFYDVSSRKAISRSALFTFLETANLIAYDTVESYLLVLKTFELVRFAEENVSIHKEILNSIRSRVESGAAGKAELERVQGRLAAAQATLIVRQNDYRRSIYNLQKYLGRIVTGPELEKPVMDMDILPTALNVALEKMRKEHPTLLAADYNIEQKNNEFDRDKSEFKPYVSLEASRNLRGNYSGIDGYDKESSVMLKMSYRLFDGGERNDMVNSAKSLIHREKLAKNRVARSLVNGLQLSWTGYKLLESQLGAVRKSILFTRQALNSYKEEFKLGKRLLINILDAEGELQNSRALFTSVKFDLLISKYRILFGLGTLADDLGLSVPFKKELLEAKNLRPASDDPLPPCNDLDADGILDEADVSPNSSSESKVSIYGETEQKTTDYLSEPVCRIDAISPSVVSARQDLLANSIKPDVPTRIDFVSFVADSEMLTEESNVLMRELIAQLKKFAGDGLIKVDVVTGEKDSIAENYSLGLRRAYNIKKILMSHTIDPEVIEVTATAADEEQKKLQKNFLVFTVTTDPLKFADGAQADYLADVKFASQTVLLSEPGKEQLKRLAVRLITLEKKQFDVIVYSKDFADAAKNRNVSRERGEVIKKVLVENGLPESSITSVAWGDYEGLTDLYSYNEKDPPNRVEIVVRE